jgi:hypothetical protein
MDVSNRILAGMACIASAACGGSDNPYDPPADADTDVDTDSDTDTGTGTGTETGTGSDTGGPGCYPTPSRLVVVGDSINACSNVGGRDGASCGPNVFHGTLSSSWAPGVTYENHAVGGAVTEDVPNEQLPDVETGVAGHVLALVFIGGNDLQPYIFITDSAAETRFESDMPRLLGEWDRIFAFFEDAAAFPDGVTMIMNTQYNPFDDCTAAPYYLSETKIRLLNEYNAELTRLAGERDWVEITDQHAAFLGHGHHYQVDTCPYFIEGADGWMDDLIHPNEVGHGHLAAEWQRTADGMYGGCE